MQVHVVEKPDTVRSNSFYGANRPPLLPNPLVKLPLGSVRGRGWLQHQLDLMAAGMVGRLEELSEFLKSDRSWLTRDGIKGAEEVPYCLRGFHDLGVLTGEERLLETSHRWLDAVFAGQQLLPRAVGRFPAEEGPVDSRLGGG